MTWRLRIGLWVVLLALFFGYSQFFPSRGGRAPMNSTLAFAIVVFFVMLFIFVLLARRSVRINNQAIALMGQGRYLEAVRMLEAAKPLIKSALIPYNLGVARLNLWRVTDARLALETAWRARGGATLRHLAAPNLALAAAVEGKVEDARRWMAEAKKLGNEASPSVLLATAVLACRSGDWAGARALLERNELNVLGGPTRGLAEALRAWCGAHGEGAPRPPDRLAMFGEAGPDSLRSVWPELVAFLTEAREASAGVAQ